MAEAHVVVLLSRLLVSLLASIHAITAIPPPTSKESAAAPVSAGDLGVAEIMIGMTVNMPIAMLLSVRTIDPKTVTNRISTVQRKSGNLAAKYIPNAMSPIRWLVLERASRRNMDS